MFPDTRKAFLLAGAFLLATAAVAQEPRQDLPAGQVSTQAVQSDHQAPILTNRQLKEQRRQQKEQEKAARESAKAQKSQAGALKHEDKATDAQEKAQPAGTVPPPPPPPQ